MAKGNGRYATGGVLAVIGIFGIFGSLTGRLAAMLAGLFCNNNGQNSALYTVSSSGSQ